jgi:hypothetical protein
MTRCASNASWILLVAAVLSAGCAKPLRPQSTAIEQVERLAVRFADDGEFTVVDERANAIHPIAAGAAFPLLALVGEAVATGVNHYRDGKSNEALRAFLESAKCRDGFQTSFEDTLRKAGARACRWSRSGPTTFASWASTPCSSSASSTAASG